jgi:hypothetical protein
MKAPPLAKNYDCLTPEERFRLILAASGRGDEVERDRLGNAGGRITLSMPDHSPYAHAFNELSLLTFIELLDDAAFYQTCFEFTDDARDIFDDDEDEGEDDTAEEPHPQADEGLEHEDAGKKPACIRTLDVTLAAGYILRTKANGWKSFCARMNVPPFLHWDMLPGFERLQILLAAAEKAAFVPEGFLRWLNRLRPEGEPELTAVPLTVEGVADVNAKAFRHRVQWWGA